MGRSDKNKGAWRCGLCSGRFENNHGLSVHMGRRHRGHVPIGTTNRRAQRADDTLDDEGYQPDREEQSSKRKRSLPALSGPALSVRSGDHTVALQATSHNLVNLNVPVGMKALSIRREDREMIVDRKMMSSLCNLFNLLELHCYSL